MITLLVLLVDERELRLRRARRNGKFGWSVGEGNGIIYVLDIMFN
jgi:hypothetical protein